MNDKPIAAFAIAEQAKKTTYPPPYASLVAGRSKRRLGDHFGLTAFGVNLTQLAPGAASALLHSHAQEDEFVYIVAGTAVLLIDTTEFTLEAGDCCGFKAGTGRAHQLVNRTDGPVTYLEVGNRVANESVDYPNADLKFGTGADGQRIWAHKDGTPY